MSDDPRPGCIGKTPFLTWTAAEKAMSRNRFHPDNRDGIVRVYRCRFCSAFHIGKSWNVKRPR